MENLYSWALSTNYRTFTKEWLVNGVSDSWIVIILDGYKYMYRVVQAPTIMKQLGALKLLCIGMEDLSVFGWSAKKTTNNAILGIIPFHASFMVTQRR